MKRTHVLPYLLLATSLAGCGSKDKDSDLDASGSPGTAGAGGSVANDDGSDAHGSGGTAAGGTGGNPFDASAAGTGGMGGGGAGGHAGTAPGGGGGGSCASNIPPEMTPPVCGWPKCGNGVRDSCSLPWGGCPTPFPVTEACDGADLGGDTCQAHGFTSGTLSCLSYCAVDLGGCR